jgi:hypothetical protein
MISDIYYGAIGVITISNILILNKIRMLRIYTSFLKTLFLQKSFLIELSGLIQKLALHPAECGFK